jgi:predicted phosphodiesterase
MRYAILSDAHGRSHKLKAVLEDIEAQGADSIMSLGDVGGSECLDMLQAASVQPIFGNYEVSGWQRAESRHRDWVRGWPPLIEGDRFVAAHAVPWQPERLQTVVDYGGWLRDTGNSWRSLFPYLTEDESYLWQTFAELEATGKNLFFHGHTHLQAVWQWEPGGRLRQVNEAAFVIKPDHRYIVGVGSAGLPEDGCWAAYALYDEETSRVELRCLSRQLKLN